MKKLLSLFIFLYSTTNLLAQDNESLSILNDQVDAFNKGDVERLVNNVSDDFVWFSLTADTLMVEVKGKDNFRKSMQSYFANDRKVVSTIANYVLDGDRISFREVVSHKNKQGEDVSSSAMGIYQIKDRKIVRAWYFID